MLFDVILMFIVIIAVVTIIYAVKHGLNVDALIERINDKLSPDGPINATFLHENASYCNECCTCIRQFIGEKEFRKLKAMSLANVPVMFGNIYNGAPYVVFKMKTDDSQRSSIEMSLISLTKKYCYLQYGITNAPVFAVWSTDSELNLSQICIYYARTDRETKLINRYIDYQKQQAIDSNVQVTDTEDEDLTDYE